MKNLNDLRILVVGDIMLDRYIQGTVNRISPEAPVPIVHVKKQYNTLGGCGNVVRNLKEIGVEVDCLASIGKDFNGEYITTELKQIGANPLLFNGSSTTIVKERIIADERKVQMLRIDREDVRPINPLLPIDIHARMVNQKKYDVVIISDYAKGMISFDLMKFLKEEHSKIIVDPKPINTGMYNGVHMITPNSEEWKVIQLSSVYTLYKVKYILETKGKDGMKLIDYPLDKSVDIPAEPVEVYNVSGAGDTVIAVMGVCLSLGLDELNAAKVANKCAGYVVTQPGTSVIPKNKFIHNLHCIIGDK